MDELQKNLHPAYLFVGPQATLQATAEQFIRQYLCAKEKNERCSCVACKQIQQRQHHALVWISPAKDYTVDDITIIFEKTKFSLDATSKFFFVLSKAHTLTQATANRLLKILEEPPAGYHFLLLTDNEEALLTTILSRCVIQHVQAPHEAQQHPLLSFFTDENKLIDPFGFEQTLQKYKLTDTESKALFETVFNHYATLINNHSSANNTLPSNKLDYYHKVIAFLQEFMAKPPQSGSSNIFWKTVYMLFPKE